MGTKGLEEILKQIRKDPGQRVLLERFLALLSELADSTEKHRLMLGLAEALLPEDPGQSMNLAYRVYQQDHSVPESLDIIWRCLNALERYDKAAIVKRELDQINQSRNEPSGTPADKTAMTDHLPSLPELSPDQQKQPSGDRNRKDQETAKAFSLNYSETEEQTGAPDHGNRTLLPSLGLPTLPGSGQNSSDQPGLEELETARDSSEFDIPTLTRMQRELPALQARDALMDQDVVKMMEQQPEKPETDGARPGQQKLPDKGSEPGTAGRGFLPLPPDAFEDPGLPEQESAGSSAGKPPPRHVTLGPHPQPYPEQPGNLSRKAQRQRSLKKTKGHLRLLTKMRLRP